jgi:hypothetical protein
MQVVPVRSSRARIPEGGHTRLGRAANIVILFVHVAVAAPSELDPLRTYPLSLAYMSCP